MEKNLKKNIYIYTYIYIYKGICYKELAHAIVEAEKS